MKHTDTILCPDCERGHIRPLDGCDNCGLGWEDLDAAADFLDNILAGKHGTAESPAPGSFLADVLR
jgi:hypothetical protein